MKKSIYIISLILFLFSINMMNFANAQFVQRKGEVHRYSDTKNLNLLNAGEDLNFEYREILIGSQYGVPNFGKYVDEAGDLNGDGFFDFIIGKPKSQYFPSEVYFYFGRQFPSNNPEIILTGQDLASHAGDVNGDGYSDIITAKLNSYVRIYLGGIHFDTIPDIVLANTFNNTYFGSSVSGAGDVNGDGYSDVIVGSNKTTGICQALIFFGGANMDNHYDVEIVPGEFGYFTQYFKVTEAGDFNDDGFSDVLIGESGLRDKGVAYLILGGAQMDSIYDLSFEGEYLNEFFGRSLSCAGDLNNDGFSDLIFASNNYYLGIAKATVYLGSESLNSIPDLILNGTHPNTSFVYCVSNAGDYNRDGYSDFIIKDADSAFIYFGGDTLDNAYDELFTIQTLAPDNFPNSISPVGDFDGDGYVDYIFGNGEIGNAFLFYSGRYFTLDIGVVFEGYYVPEWIFFHHRADSISLSLRLSYPPYEVIENVTVNVAQTGFGSTIFPDLQPGNYYIVLNHRNSIETWSSQTIEFTSSNLFSNYVFHSSITQAYGNNMKQLNEFTAALYGGDVNQDGIIDGVDIGLIEIDSYNFASGELTTDITGDGFIDGSDMIIADNNAFNFVHRITP